MKVIIAGGREFNNYDLLCESCNKELATFESIEIVSGGAKGADKLGEQYANENGYDIKKFLPEWAKYGKGAGVKRNEEMAKYAEVLIAFWDGKSKGTKSMIDLAKRYGLKVKVVIFN